MQVRTSRSPASGMAGLKRIVEDSSTRAGKVFDLSIQFLIVLSLVSFAVETLPGLDTGLRTYLGIAEAVIVIIFSLEYLLRMMVADRKLGFAFSFYGLIDLAAILPFYIAMGVDLRSVRVFRLLRLFRIFKMMRYSAAIERLRGAFVQTKQELILFGVASGLLLYVASVGIYYFESAAQPETFQSVFHCLWWAVVTLTTVGYGDAYPVTVGGKVFTSIIAILGVGIVAVPTGLFASALTRTVGKDE